VLEQPFGNQRVACFTVGACRNEECRSRPRSGDLDLADEGVRFSNYHTSPMCAPSRAMLLTGLDSHRTGVATLPEVISEAQRDASGYALRLLPGVETIADLLKKGGYQTFMTGKWHLGRGEGDLPNGHGFDRSFALDASGADNWEQKSFIPFYDEAPWFEDGTPAQLPEDFNHRIQRFGPGHDGR
jgi:arylsulfatase A-like enzyme